MKFIGKFFKSVFKTILWLLVVILICVVALYVSAGKLIQRFAPAAISQVTQTEASLGDVDISLFSGRVTLNNLDIGNPAGYKNKNAVELGKFDVQFDPKSVLTNKIVIHKVQISGLNVSSEAKTNGETNITRLRDNVAASLNKGAQPVATPATPEQAPAPVAESKEQTAVVIKDLLIDNSAVNVALSGIPGLTNAALAATVPLPDIHLQNIGENKKQTLGETVWQVINVVDKEVVKASAKAISDATQKALQSGKDTANAIKDTFKNLFQ